MKVSKKVVLWVFVICSLAVVTNVRAQARYDDHKPNETFSLNFGGYRQIDHNTTIRFDSSTLGLGTIISLEDQLNVQNKTSMVFKLDGHYRFNYVHRMEWLWYSSSREGTAQILEGDIQIGDEIFEVGDVVFTRNEFDVIKLGYAWSFINVEPNEFFLGIGLNIRKSRFYFQNILETGGETEIEEFDATGTIPLPTVTFGGRYNFTERWMLDFKYEVFALEYGDYAGRLQESSFNIEHNSFKNIGFGLGITNFNFFIQADDGEYRGEIDSNYFGLSMYMKTYF